MCPAVHQATWVSERNAAWKSDMEDRVNMIDNFGSNANKMFINVVDGYHGDNAANIVADELPNGLLCQLSHIFDDIRCSCVEEMTVEIRLLYIHLSGPPVERNHRDKK